MTGWWCMARCKRPDAQSRRGPCRSPAGSLQFSRPRTVDLGSPLPVTAIPRDGELETKVVSRAGIVTMSGRRTERPQIPVAVLFRPNSLLIRSLCSPRDGTAPKLSVSSSVMAPGASISISPAAVATLIRRRCG